MHKSKNNTARCTRHHLLSYVSLVAPPPIPLWTHMGIRDLVEGTPGCQHGTHLAQWMLRSTWAARTCIPTLMSLLHDPRSKLPTSSASIQGSTASFSPRQALNLETPVYIRFVSPGAGGGLAPVQTLRQERPFCHCPTIFRHHNSHTYKTNRHPHHPSTIEPQLEPLEPPRAIAVRPELNQINFVRLLYLRQGGVQAMNTTMVVGPSAGNIRCIHCRMFHLHTPERTLQKKGSE